MVVMSYELDRSAREERGDDTTDGLPMSLAELEASAKRVLGADAPLRPASPDAPLDLRRFSGINSRIAFRYQVGRVSGRRCRARPLANRWTRSQSWLAGRGEPRLEAGGRSKWARGAHAAGHL